MGAMGAVGEEKGDIFIGNARLALAAGFLME